MTLITAESRTELFNEEPKPGSVSTCATVDDEVSDITETIIAGYEDGSVMVLNLTIPAGVRGPEVVGLQRSLSEKCYVKFHENPITCVDFCVETQRGVSVSADGTLAAWILSEHGNITLKKSMGTLSSAKPGLGCVRIRLDGKLVIVGRNDGGINLYGGRKMTPLVSAYVHTGGVQVIAFDVDSSFAVGAVDRIISIWSLYKSK